MKARPPGDATMSPMVARIRQVEPASVARKLHFSHISSSMLSLRRGWNLTPCISASMASTRAERPPARSP